MAKNNKKENKRPFKNPASTLWGKIFIWVLAVAMACGGIFSLVYLIIQSVNNI